MEKKMAVTSREDLYNYVVARIGLPCSGSSDVNQVQFDSIVDEVLLKFYEYAMGFSQEERVLYLPTVAGQTIYDISEVDPQPTAVITEFDSFNTNMWTNLNTLFTIENMMIHKWGFNLNTPDMLTFQMIYNWLDSFKTLYGRQYQGEINEKAKTIKIMPMPQDDGGIFFAVYAKRPEVECIQYSWVQRMVYARMLQQIGFNRGKYSNITLPGGATINYEMYYTRGVELENQLTEELYSAWSEPIDFRIE
jgi:hypothetical protein